ncbi:futalosine hydrolase [Cnuella takakiae]|nr:futalosine hydrolase [Cnuella takakiae]OLY93613.1 futalosine hydrolase [Cnuella takakiae]
MHLLICAATEMEIAALQTAVAKRTLPPAHSIRFLVTGVGIGPSMYQLTKHLCLQKPDLVVQAGIAGTLDPKLLPGDTVVVDADTFGDAGVVENKQFRNLFDLGLQDANLFPYKDGFLLNPFTHWLSLPGLQVVRGITVNEVSTNTDRIQQYRLQWGAQVESMEGASLHYACLQEGIPFLQLRSISNAIGERDKKKWKMKEAVQNLHTELNLLIDKILEL